MPYPVTFKADYVEKRSRLTTFFRGLLAIPHIIFLYFYGLAAGVVVIIAWFALLFTGRYPLGMYDFVSGSLRYSTRVYGYLWLLNDEYPPFSGSATIEAPVDLIIAAPKAEYSRLKVLFRIILAIPVLIIHYAMQIVAQLGAVIAWFAILLLGRQPKGLQDMIALGTSYQQRAYAYLALITEDWPPFTDDMAGGRVEAAPAFGALAASPPAAGPEHPTSVPPGGYASPEREAAFPPPSAPEPDPPATLAEPAAPEAPPTEPSFTVEPAEPAAPEPPAAAPEPGPPSEPEPTGPTSGDPLGGGAAPPPPPPPAPEPPTEPSPPSPGDWPDPEPASGPPSPGDWPDPEPPKPRDDDEDEPPPGPFGPSSTNQ